MKLPIKVKVTPQQKLSTILLELKNNNIINQEQYNKLNMPIKKLPTRETFIQKLVDVGAIEPRDPLDVSIKDFTQDLGSLNAADITLLINCLRTDKKGLHNMTPVPQKAFPIPANILFFAIIGIALAVVIIAPNWQSIMHGMQMGNSGGINNNPLTGLLGSFMPHHFLYGINVIRGYGWF